MHVFMHNHIKIEIAGTINVTMHAVRMHNGAFSLTTTDGDTNFYLPITYSGGATLQVTVRNGILYGLTNPYDCCFVLYEIGMNSIHILDTVCRCGRGHSGIGTDSIVVREEPAYLSSYKSQTTLVTIDWNTLKLALHLVRSPPDTVFWGVLSTYKGMCRVYVYMAGGNEKITIDDDIIIFPSYMLSGKTNIQWTNIYSTHLLHLYILGGTTLIAHLKVSSGEIALDLITGETTVSNTAEIFLSCTYWPENIKTVLCTENHSSYSLNMYNIIDGTCYNVPVGNWGAVRPTAQLLNRPLDTNKYGV
jgi:hypothetical protein